jgi:hypothetical protein
MPPVLRIDSAITEIVQAYIRHRVMPADPAGNALHLALASYQRGRSKGTLHYRWNKHLLALSYTLCSLSIPIEVPVWPWNWPGAVEGNRRRGSGYGQRESGTRPRSGKGGGVTGSVLAARIAKE